MALGSVGMALHHKICHTLGGSFDLPHAETHTVMLAHTAAFNAPTAGSWTRLGELLAGQPKEAILIWSPPVAKQPASPGSG